MNKAARNHSCRQHDSKLKIFLSYDVLQFAKRSVLSLCWICTSVMCVYSAMFMRFLFRVISLLSVCQKQLLGLMSSIYRAEVFTAIQTSKLLGKRVGQNQTLAFLSKLLTVSQCALVANSLYNRWIKCTNLAKTFSFRISHIYREANACANKFASFGA